MTWGGGRGTVVLISVQLLEMELVPFRKKKRRKGGEKKEERWKKPPFSVGSRQRMCFFLVWRLAMESCMCGTCSQATRSWQSCMCEFLTSLNLLFRPWAWFGEMRVCQTLIRQEARGKGTRVGKGGNSREGWKPKLLVPKGALETCFSYFELTSLKQLSLLLIKLNFHIQMSSFPLT